MRQARIKMRRIACFQSVNHTVDAEPHPALHDMKPFFAIVLIRLIARSVGGDGDGDRLKVERLG